MVLRKAPEAGGAGAEPDLLGLIQACPELQQATRIVAAFSGGLDSTVLLHLLREARRSGLLQAPLQALHVNHALQADADRWEQHCRAVCARLGVPFDSVRAPVPAVAGESVEESARNTRHAVFKEKVQAGEAVAVAQHGDDQVETVLFRLLRGSGVAGLAGMPRCRPCGKGMLVRPLLDATRAQLQDYARAHGLSWIEDGSNVDQRFDRNFLRAAVLPQLRQRWPGIGDTIARTAELSGEAAGLLDELAADDMRAAAGPTPGQLAMEPLRSLGAARQRNVLRYWLQQLCRKNAWALPPYRVLARILPEVIDAAPDAEPLLTWGEGTEAVELRRHRGMLHAMAPLPVPPVGLAWATAHPLTLPSPLGELELRPSAGGGLPRDRLATMRVCFRGGGELVKAAGRPTRPLKKILQEAGVPSWLRARVPLLYVGDELVAVADLLVCEGWANAAPGNSCCIEWRHPDLDCGYPPHLLI